MILQKLEQDFQISTQPFLFCEYEPTQPFSSIFIGKLTSKSIGVYPTTHYQTLYESISLTSIQISEYSILKEAGLTSAETGQKNYFFGQLVKLRFLRAQKCLGAQIWTAIAPRAPGSKFSNILRGFSHILDFNH